tara:strand:- start:4942 stop:5280 length:339 start_codon:yes stop_codon:yes gene_type:complete
MDNHGFYRTVENLYNQHESPAPDQQGGDASVKQTKRLIEMIEGQSGFDWLDDGFVYYFPGPRKGCLSAWSLRAIADELDRRNKQHEDEIEEYFKEHLKGEEDERESRERFDD